MGESKHDLYPQTIAKGHQTIAKIAIHQQLQRISQHVPEFFRQNMFSVLDIYHRH
jgi:predicted CoA-binding protein